MLKILLFAALVQPLAGVSRPRGVLPRRRAFQRKPRQTYGERKRRLILRMIELSMEPFDLNCAA